MKIDEKPRKNLHLLLEVCRIPTHCFCHAVTRKKFCVGHKRTTRTSNKRCVPLKDSIRYRHAHVSAFPLHLQTATFTGMNSHRAAQLVKLIPILVIPILQQICIIQKFQRLN